LKDAFSIYFMIFKKSTKVPVPPNWPYVNQLISQLHFFKIIGEQGQYAFEEGDFFIHKVAPKIRLGKKLYPLLTIEEYARITYDD